MNTCKRYSVSLALTALLLSACGGGGGGGLTLSDPISPGGGIGGTGITSSGTIDGFGSIFVNGVEFETGDAQIIVNGRSGSEDDLGLGMIVLVDGRVDDNRVTGNATQVIFDNEIQGPVTAITPNADGDALLLEVLGIGVIAERTGTVFDDVTFDTLAVGDLVEVSGFPNEDGQLRATRIEKKSNFVAGSSEIELKGVVANLSGTTFSIGQFSVDFSNADLSDLPGATVSDGLTVEVHGTLQNQVINATRVEREDGFSRFLDDDDEVEIKGAITGYVSNGNFSVNGVPVDASSAILRPQDLALANGVVVEVEGDWNGSTLLAREVKARRGRVEIEAAVASVDTANRALTLRLFPGNVSVVVDSQTRLDDDTDGVDNLRLADLASGDFVEVEALQSGGELLATRVDRDDRDDDILQAPVEAFSPGLDITLLGITYSTQGAEFEDENDNDITSSEFYARLQVGDLVKIKDEETADGIADEVEFERADDLDGDREFDGDCDDDSDSSDDDSDGSCGSGSDDDDDSSDDDNGGSGSDNDDDSDDDNSGSGSDDDDFDDDNSGSGSDDDDPDDNSGQ